jgi:hypothetical protein
VWGKKRSELPISPRPLLCKRIRIVAWSSCQILALLLSRRTQIIARSACQIVMLLEMAPSLHPKKFFSYAKMRSADFEAAYRVKLRKFKASNFPTGLLHESLCLTSPTFLLSGAE